MFFVSSVARDVARLGAFSASACTGASAWCKTYVFLRVPSTRRRASRFPLFFHYSRALVSHSSSFFFLLLLQTGDGRRRTVEKLKKERKKKKKNPRTPTSTASLSHRCRQLSVSLVEFCCRFSFSFGWALFNLLPLVFII